MNSMVKNQPNSKAIDWRSAPFFKRILVQASILPMFLLAGCFGAQAPVPMRYYRVEPQVEVQRAEQSNVTLGVRPFVAARPYRLPIAYLQEGNLIQFREFDSWAEAPADIVTRAVTEAIHRTGRFRDAGNAAEMARPQLELNGNVLEFHENRADSPTTAEVEVRLELREALGETLVWEATLRGKVPLAEDTSAALSDAMAEAVAQLAEQAAAGIVAAPLPPKLIAPPPAP